MAEHPTPSRPSASNRASSRAPNAHPAHRIHNSCDRCRGRKTKCIDPVPGPCRYCARIGAPCSIATPRRKRPYYHVTEEEYQCSMRILEYFFPSQNLNLQSLRAIAKAIKDGTFNASPVQYANALFTQTGLSPEELESNDIEEEQDVSELHEPLGCMMRDSMGRYRYVGAQSEIPFNSAVVSLGRNKPNPSIIIPPKTGAWPPVLASTESAIHLGKGRSYYLPPRHLGDMYVSKFLKDVHCTYWLYPIEYLLHRVNETYLQIGPPPSPSWVCSLYMIFAIGAANYTGSHSQSPPPGSYTALDHKTSEDYIALAKQLIPAIYDEADVDSIRAMAMLSITMETLCSRISAYLYIGAAVQMAYSLGFHRDQVPEGALPTEREQNQRIWWTLYTLDQELALRGGTPTVIDERFTRITTPLPTEQLLYPGLHTPRSWLAASISLLRIKRDIVQTIYTERSSNYISFSTVSNFLLLLQKWQRQIPPSVRNDASVPSTQKRAVAELQLQYWSTTILLTRSFLLYLVIKYNTLATSKRMWFEKMGQIAIDAAQKSLTILQQMVRDATLSSLTAFDSTCILRIVAVFILAYVHTRIPLYKTHIETCIQICKSMQQVGFTKMVTDETPGRLIDLGIFQKPITITNESQTQAPPTDDLPRWSDWDSTTVTPLQTQQTLDLTFDDSAAFELDSGILAFTDVDESIVIDPLQYFTQYNLG